MDGELTLKDSEELKNSKKRIDTLTAERLQLDCGSGPTSRLKTTMKS